MAVVVSDTTPLHYLIKGDLALLDDKVARRIAQRKMMKVKGTLGIVADAAKANLLDFVETVKVLQRTGMHLDEAFVPEIVEEPSALLLSDQQVGRVARTSRAASGSREGTVTYKHRT
jgi:hypothetical protein